MIDARLTRRFLLIAVNLVVVCVVLRPDDGLAADLYSTTIKPLLATKCYACHGAIRQASGLRLDAATLIQQGGESGPVVQAGQPEASELLRRVTTSDHAERMPPEGEGEPLTAEQTAAIKEWIHAGAVAPDEPIPVAPQNHWAYQPIAHTNIGSSSLADGQRDTNNPALIHDDVIHNPIDVILSYHHRQQGLQPAPPANKRTWLRRIYLDLIGIPPTPEQQAAYLSDTGKSSSDQVIAELLDSPQFGERWARHWMDIWRYSDWTGFGDEIRYSQKHIWHWRDWIIESLNADIGYDRMVQLMLAADEIAPEDRGAQRATGFLARNWYKFDRNTWIDDTVEHTCRAFLGVSIRCARCHDHKYDPISQLEYYQLRAIFEPYDVRTDSLPPSLNIDTNGIPRAYDAKLTEPTLLFVRGNPQQADPEQRVEPNVPAILGGRFDVSPVAIPLSAYYPDFSPDRIAARRQQLQDDVRAAHQSMVQSDVSDVVAPRRYVLAQRKLEAFNAQVLAEEAKHGVGEGRGRSATETATNAAFAERQARFAEAEWQLADKQQSLAAAKLAVEMNPSDKSKAESIPQLTQQVQESQTAYDQARAALATSGTEYSSLGPLYSAVSTGRRTAFARWITSSDNPLAARVAVNHIWLRHFGQPLVASVDDFGLRAARPELLELLDYLARELIEHDWSLKHIHRLIVRSAAYERSVSVATDHPSWLVDPENQWFWRRTDIRMDSEQVRDSILAISQALDTRMTGPDIASDQGMSVARRSLYFKHARERQMQFLMTFDAANPNECYRRQVSVLPQQSFALINSPLVISRSRALASYLSDKATNHTEESFVQEAFETILARLPSPAELRECRDFLAQQERQLTNTSGLTQFTGDAAPVPPASNAAARARENLILVLFNHHDFITIH